MRRAAAIATFAAVALFAGCESTQEVEAESQPATTQVSMGTLNETCPLSGAAVNPDVTADYHGQKIGFCCSDCLGTWDGWSDDRKAKYVATLE